MFFPTVEEHDVYAANGVMVDEINSVYEYIDEVLLGDKDDTPEDEDDDEPDFYQLVKIESFYFHEIGIEIIDHFAGFTSKVSYPKYNIGTPPSLSYDIVVPPPQV